MDATYAWLRRNFSGFVERLRRDHDLSPGDFYDAVSLPPNPDEADDAWGICYEPTIRGLEDYPEELEPDRGRAATTVGPRRSRPKTYSTTYKKVNETDDLLHDGGTTTATAPGGPTALGVGLDVSLDRLMPGDQLTLDFKTAGLGAVRDLPESVTVEMLPEGRSFNPESGDVSVNFLGPNALPDGGDIYVQVRESALRRHAGRGRRLALRTAVDTGERGEHDVRTAASLNSNAGHGLRWK